MLRLGWFSTGRDDAARELLSIIDRKKREGVLDISIEFVFSNWRRGEGAVGPEYRARERFFGLVDELGIPLVTLSWKGFRPDLREANEQAWRAGFGKAMLQALTPYHFDIGVLAGYMQWLDDETCREHPFINLHPALPGGPIGTWLEVIWSLIASRADRHGATVHLCTPDRDRGTPLAFCSFAVRGPGYNALWTGYDAKVRGKGAEWVMREEGEDEPLFRHIRHDEAVREGPLLAHSLKLLAEGKVHIKGQCVYEGDRELDRPCDLTREVDRAVKGGELKEAGHGL